MITVKEIVAAWRGPAGRAVARRNDPDMPTDEKAASLMARIKSGEQLLHEDWMRLLYANWTKGPPAWDYVGNFAGFCEWYASIYGPPGPKFNGPSRRYPTNAAAGNNHVLSEYEGRHIVETASPPTRGGTRRSDAGGTRDQFAGERIVALSGWTVEAG
jgi:hypothetical protein